MSDNKTERMGQCGGHDRRQPGAATTGRRHSDGAPERIDEVLLRLVNQVREHKGKPTLATITRDLRLQGDLGFNSLDLAEFTVRIEERFGVDVFADGLVHTVGEIEVKISRAKGK